MIGLIKRILGIQNIYQDAYDNYLLDLINTKKVIELGMHTIEFEGGVKIWIANGRDFHPWKPIEIRIKPSRKVAIQFEKFLGQKFLEGLADKDLSKEISDSQGGL